MYTVYAEPPPELTRIRTGWVYAKDYFPHHCDTVSEARAIAKLAIKAGGLGVQIIADHPNPDSEPEIVPIAEPTFPGVVTEFCRNYVCGLAIKKYGLAHGVTDELVAYVQEGTPDWNAAAVRNALVIAWHAIRAWDGSIPSPVPEEDLAKWNIKTEADWWAATEDGVQEYLAKETAIPPWDQPF